MLGRGTDRISPTRAPTPAAAPPGPGGVQLDRGRGGAGSAAGGDGGRGSPGAGPRRRAPTGWFGPVAGSGRTDRRCGTDGSGAAPERASSPTGAGGGGTDTAGSGCGRRSRGKGRSRCAPSSPDRAGTGDRLAPECGVDGAGGAPAPGGVGVPGGPPAT